MFETPLARRAELRYRAARENPNAQTILERLLFPPPPVEVWSKPPERARQRQSSGIGPIVQDGRRWGRQMTRDLVLQSLTAQGHKGDDMVKAYERYDDYRKDDERSSSMMRDCPPDPERVAAHYNMQADDWMFTPLRMNLFSPTRSRSGCCVCNASKVSKDAFMQASRVANENYSSELLYYTRLPYGKFFFTDQAIDCNVQQKMKEATTEGEGRRWNIHPSGAIHVHTHPKWRWAVGTEGTFISCKIWVPENAPIYFYLHHATRENYAALLFAHTLRIDDMYYTEESNERVQNVVIGHIEVYDARDIDVKSHRWFGTPQGYDLVTPGNFNIEELYGKNKQQPPDPFYEER